MCDTNLPEHSYDAIIDKALFDAVLCNPSGDKFNHALVYEVLEASIARELVFEYYANLVCFVVLGDSIAEGRWSLHMHLIWKPGRQAEVP